MVEGRLQFVIEDRFHLSCEQGYWCRLGEPGMQAHQVIVTTSPSTDVFIPVNLYHFVFGLHFPMHWFLQKVLCFYQLSLNQLIPQALRKIISFIWHYEYMGYPLTLDLFRSLFKIEQGGNKSYYLAKVVNGATVVVPDLSDLKYYFDKTVWVRVPLTVDHPYQYNLPIYCTTPVLHPLLTMDEVRELSRLERYAFLHFQGWTNESTAQEYNHKWLCHEAVLRREPVLSLVEMSTFLTSGKHD